MILYVPRHQGDYDVIREIIHAAVWHATEGRLYPLTADTYPIPPAPTAKIQAHRLEIDATKPLLRNFLFTCSFCFLLFKELVRQFLAIFLGIIVV
ncbi:hypothetical protein GGR51DRAFT_203071 [Nemania sp. FL0031]|nr:hypothetical protein GGR51DRAFT_203071 [Nemania sp. FL0031]